MIKSLLILSSIVIAGCASSQRMSVSDLDSFRIDCANYDQQREFLVKQYPSRQDRQAALFATMTLTGILNSIDEKTYEQHQAIRRGELQAAIKHKIQQLDIACGRR